jgi:hypothetical protein
VISIFVLVALHVPVLMGYFYSSTQTRHDKMRRYLIVFDLDLLDDAYPQGGWPDTFLRTFVG